MALLIPQGLLFKQRHDLLMLLIIANRDSMTLLKSNPFAGSQKKLFQMEQNLLAQPGKFGPAGQEQEALHCAASIKPKNC